MRAGQDQMLLHTADLLALCQTGPRLRIHVHGQDSRHHCVGLFRLFCLGLFLVALGQRPFPTGRDQRERDRPPVVAVEPSEPAGRSRRGSRRLLELPELPLGPGYDQSPVPALRIDQHGQRSDSGPRAGDPDQTSEPHFSADLAFVTTVVVQSAGRGDHRAAGFRDPRSVHHADRARLTGGRHDRLASGTVVQARRAGRAPSQLCESPSPVPETPAAG